MSEGPQVLSSNCYQRGSSSKKDDCKGNESRWDSSQAVVKEELLLLEVHHVAVTVGGDRDKRESKRRDLLRGLRNLISSSAHSGVV